ncbi:MAG: N-acetyltransferase family protein [Halanaeroarchaeum sp.]
MDVRRAGNDDVPALVAELWLPFYRELAALDEWDALTDADLATEGREHFERALDREDVVVLLATDDEVSGFATVERRRAPPIVDRNAVVHVHELYVRPRDRRNGVATALLQRAEKLCRDVGCDGVELAVHPENDRAYRLYESVGFRSTRHRMVKRVE